MTLNPTFALNLYSKFRAYQLNKIDPIQQQEKILLKLVKRAQNTAFGKDHDFEKIDSIKAYQAAVPLRNYEDFWKEYWKPHFPDLSNTTWPGQIKYLAVTSGTSTGTTKYLPLPREMIRSNTKAGLDILVNHYRNFPNSKILSGKSFVLGGSTELVQEAPNIFSGDLSGIATKTLAWYAKPFYFPRNELALISDWEEKINCFAAESLKHNITLITGVPSWMLILFKKLFELKPEAEGKLHKVFPNLEAIIHGGVNFAPYYKQFQQITEGSNIQYREVYPASEGFIAISDKNYGEGLRLNIDNDIFYEFVPVSEIENPSPPRHTLNNVEKDLNYAIVLTSCSGAWSYIMGDTVKFVDLNPHRILITGRISYYLSAFGEHLIDEEIEDAVTTAANDINFSVIDYSVAPVYPSTPEELGGHMYVIEFKEGIPSEPEAKRFTQILDRKLCERNEDYAAHRSAGYGLNPPKLLAVQPGIFNAWMKSRGKLGGQNKVPRIINNQELFENLLSFADCR